VQEMRLHELIFTLFSICIAGSEEWLTVGTTAGGSQIWRTISATADAGRIWGGGSKSGNYTRLRIVQWVRHLAVHFISSLYKRTDVELHTNYNRCLLYFSLLGYERYRVNAHFIHCQREYMWGLLQPTRHRKGWSRTI
jgi:hypothetical protein